MGAHEYPLVVLRAHGDLRVTVYTYEYLWICMGAYGYLWVPMGHQRSKEHEKRPGQLCESPFEHPSTPRGNK
jgi:hypothetical protein